MDEQRLHIWLFHHLARRPIYGLDANNKPLKTLKKATKNTIFARFKMGLKLWEGAVSGAGVEGGGEERIFGSGRLPRTVF